MYTKKFNNKKLELYYCCSLNEYFVFFSSKMNKSATKNIVKKIEYCYSHSKKLL